MAGSIINNWEVEVVECEREYQYWMQQAMFFETKAKNEDDVAAAMMCRAEAARCENLAEKTLSDLEHLRRNIRMAREIL